MENGKVIDFAATKGIPLIWAEKFEPALKLNVPLLTRVQSAKQCTYEELQTATDKLDPKYKIGQGRFSSLFEGILDDGTFVIVKAFSSQSEQGEWELLKEIESGIKKHEDLKFYGSCSEGNHRMLVYGVAGNDSLAENLLRPHSNNFQLLWERRSQFCSSLAQGLLFIHEEASPRTVYGDIKASDVLVGIDFPNSVTHISMSAARTPGHMAPEYVFTGTLTTKSVVYSYGVALLEIVSGRRNGDMRFPDEEQYLVAWAWRLYVKGDLVLMVDKALGGGSVADEACKYLKIGLLCTQELAEKRPTMSDVAKMLKGEIDVDKIKMPKPGKLIAYFAEGSSTYKPRASLLGSCFCFG